MNVTNIINANICINNFTYINVITIICITIIHYSLVDNFFVAENIININNFYSFLISKFLILF